MQCIQETNSTGYIQCVLNHAEGQIGLVHVVLAHRVDLHPSLFLQKLLHAALVFISQLFKLEPNVTAVFVQCFLPDTPNTMRLSRKHSLCDFCQLLTS